MPIPVDTERCKELVEAGVQLVDVLPPKAYLEDHLPGAVSLPLGDIASAPERLDPARPVAVYCYDYQ
jgi:rhodanese-related sulfurtransferase